MQKVALSLPRAPHPSPKAILVTIPFVLWMSMTPNDLARSRDALSLVRLRPTGRQRYYAYMRNVYTRNDTFGATALLAGLLAP